MLESFCREGWDAQLNGAELVKSLCCSEQVFCSQSFGVLMIWAQGVMVKCLSHLGKPAFKRQKIIETGHQSIFFLDCIAEGYVLLTNRLVEDILPFFTLVIALECLTAEQQKYLQVIVAICSLAFDTKMLQCLSQCMSLSLTCLLPRLLLCHETFRGFSSENLRSRIRVKAWLYPMIPSGLSHSYPPPTQENNLVPLCFANARISWQSDLSVQSNAIKCPTTDFGDCYKGWWNHAFIFRDFKYTDLCMEWREHWWQAGSKRRIAGKQSGTVLEC